MSNTMLNTSMIAKELLLQFKNNLVLAKNVNRQYESEFAKKGAKIGNVVNARKPHRFEVQDGRVMKLQNTTDQTVPVTIDRQKHVAFSFASSDLTLNIDDFSSRYLKPAGMALANQVDSDLAELARLTVANSVGTPGTAPSTSAAALTLALQAGQKLDENSCPQGKRSMILSPAGQVAFVGGLSGLQQSAAQLSKQYEKGKMFDAAGFSWYMDQNIAMHTVGKLGGAPAIKTTIVAQNAKQVDFDGATQNITGIFVAGDVITIDGVYALNPISKVNTGSLRQFVVTEDANSDGSGEGVIKFEPAIITEGAYRNCSALPVDGGVIRTFGHASSYATKLTPTGIAMHEDAFTLVMVDLELPGGVDRAAVARDAESGISIRVVRDFDINNDQFPCRVDVLYGVKELYPEWACRLHI